MNNITTIALSLKNRRTGETVEVPAGTVISWKAGKATATWVEGGETKERPIGALSAARGLEIEQPDLDQLSEWVHDGICDSILGERVEPDGIDEHGSPSWLLAMGMI